MGYDTGSRLFHWITVLLVLIMIAAGLLMTQELPRSLTDPLFILHKGLGPVLLLVLLLRLLWRSLHPAPPLPASIPAAQRAAAAVVHAALYVLLIVMAVSGYVYVDAGDYPLEVLRGLGLPQIIPKNEALAARAESIHTTVIWMLLLALVVHIGAAAYHGARRDGVVARMWPPMPR